MDIQSTKIELIQMLLQTQKESLLLRLKKVFEEEQTDWWEDMSSEEREEIQEGLLQADKGEYRLSKEVMNRFKKWH